MARNAGILLLGLSCMAVSWGCAGQRALIDEEGKQERAKTLLKWTVGRPEKDEDKDKEDKKPDGEKKNGNGSDDEPKPKEEEKDEIVTDRPDFSEAARTVGQGRVQLEGGYTFTSKAAGAGFTWTHTYPELLLRVGLFAEWFELRVGQFWTNRVDTTTGNRLVAAGAEDLYVGVKLALTEQKRFLPETGLILQTLVPTGATAFTNREIMPGVNFCYGWDLIKDRLTLGGSLLFDRVTNDLGQQHALISTSTSIGLDLTKKLGMFTEWYALCPVGSIAPGSGVQHYLNAGFTWKWTRNFQLDIRGGKGLSATSDDYFAGAGFAIRR